MTDTKVTRAASMDAVPTDARASREQTGKPLLAVGIALVLGAAVLLFVRFYSGVIPLWGLVPLGILAFTGLVVLVGAVAGFVHFGRMPRQRAFFDSLINGLGEACAISDRSGRVLYSNDEYRNLMEQAGYSRIVSMENLYSGYPDISRHIYRLSHVARDNESGAEEFRLAAGSSAAGASADKPAWFRLSVAPVGASLGRQYVMWRLKDISVERAGQESAFSHLQYIINYLDHAPAGFFSTRDDGQIAYINATLANWLGMDVVEAEEGQLRLEDIVGKDDAAQIYDIHPKPQETTTAVFNVDLKPKKGAVVPVKIIHRTDFDQNGRPQPSRSLVLDRRMTNVGDDGSSESLRFSRLMKNSPLGIVELSIAGEITSTNDAFGDVCSGHHLGAKLTELLVDQDAKEVIDAIRLASENDGSPVMVNVTFKKDEESKATLVISRLDLEDEAAATVFAFVVDTTKHLLLEEQLAQSQKMQAVGQLAGGVAHDFNNVLTAIIGFSDLLLTKHRPADPSFADIMNIKQNANRAANLVRQLLAFSRRQTLRPEIMSLSDVLGDLGNLLGRLLGETVELKVMHGRDLWPVKVDINQFEQVIINLCVNARDAMNNKGRLTVRTSNISEDESAAVSPSIMPAADYVLCEVSDTGSGMPQEVIDKIYEPFFSTKDVGKGTGLGLSTVYGIVKQTGGFIFCDSEVGKGTVFSIYLPRHIITESDVEAEVEVIETRVDAKKADMTGKGTILLVEDEDAVRAFASRALQTRGFTVVEAESGEAALEIIDDIKDEIELVLSDVVMPEVDGPTMLKEMRKRGITTKFIFISGYAEDAFEKNLEGEEDFAFLPKPFSLKQLTEAVKEAMQS